MPGVALVRRPSPRLADGIVTHIKRSPVDIELAFEQHANYIAALAAAGWRITQVAHAPHLPDSVFVEDTVVVAGTLNNGTAVLTRPGTLARQGEVEGTAAAIASLGLNVVEVEAPATIDGGDVLQIGQTVYVGRGGRTNADGVRALRSALAPQGCTVIPVALRAVLHLKSAITALPDGTIVGAPDLERLLDPSPLPTLRPVPEEGGSHVVPLGGGAILMAASAPITAAIYDDLGFDVVSVDISEFEKLEGCVTCLSVLISD